MKIEQSSQSTGTELWKSVEPKVKAATYLENAAQELATGLHTKFSESVALARVFFTVSYDSLPQTNKEFVQNLAQSAGAASSLKGTTPVLSLLGTHGQEPDWNDRRKSKGHHRPGWLRLGGAPVPQRNGRVHAGIQRPVW